MVTERSPVKEAFLAFLADMNMKSDDQRIDAVETYPEKPICTFLKAVGALVPDTTDIADTSEFKAIKKLLRKKGAFVTSSINLSMAMDHTTPTTLLGMSKTIRDHFLSIKKIEKKLLSTHFVHAKNLKIMKTLYTKINRNEESFLKYLFKENSIKKQ